MLAFKRAFALTCATSLIALSSAGGRDQIAPAEYPVLDFTPDTEITKPTTQNAADKWLAESAEPYAAFVIRHTAHEIYKTKRIRNNFTIASEIKNRTEFGTQLVTMLAESYEDKNYNQFARVFQSALFFTDMAREFSLKAYLKNMEDQKYVHDQTNVHLWSVQNISNDRGVKNGASLALWPVTRDFTDGQRNPKQDPYKEYREQVIHNMIRTSEIISKSSINGFINSTNNLSDDSTIKPDALAICYAVRDYIKNPALFLSANTEKPDAKPKSGGNKFQPK